MTDKDAADLELFRVNYFLMPFVAKMNTRPEFTEKNKYPARFLSYCYYQKYHEKDNQMGLKGVFTLEDGLSRFEGGLSRCMDARINGYSALGAAIVARGVSIDDKRNFIQQLLNYGFELTKKDSALLKIEFCDGLPADQQAKMILLLCNHAEGNLSALPRDVRKLIVECMMRFHLIIP